MFEISVKFALSLVTFARFFFQQDSISDGLLHIGTKHSDIATNLGYYKILKDI